MQDCGRVDQQAGLCPQESPSWEQTLCDPRQLPSPVGTPSEAFGQKYEVFVRQKFIHVQDKTRGSLSSDWCGRRAVSSRTRSGLALSAVLLWDTSSFHRQAQLCQCFGEDQSHMTHRGAWRGRRERGAPGGEQAPARHLTGHGLWKHHQRQAGPTRTLQSTDATGPGPYLSTLSEAHCAPRRSATCSSGKDSFKIEVMYKQHPTSPRNPKFSV